MIRIPETGYIYRILAIDNGTNTLGAVIADIDLRTGHMTVVFAETCNASLTAHRWNNVAELHGDRFARYRVLRLFLLDVMDQYDPDAVIVEGPFMHLHAEAFGKLRESLYLIRETAYEHYEQLTVSIVAPMSAKKAVKASSYTQGKNPVRDAVLNLKDVSYVNGVIPEMLDEHCIDAVAVGYYEKMRAMEARTRRR